MPIEGDLKSLNLTSVLQLISQERLTGVLKIGRKAEIIAIGFIDGRITGAFYEKGEEFERLEAYLVKSGIIGKNLFDMVEQIHRETKRPVMNILLEDKYLTAEEVQRIIRFKIQEVFDKIFTWQEGEFKFEQGAVMYPKSLIKIRMDTEGLILEAARRFDEWPRIAKEIPSGDLVYKKLEKPELKLQPQEDEVRVLSLVDGHRTVDDSVEISGLGKFHTYSCLYHLLSAGQIEIAYAKPSPEQIRPKKAFVLKTLINPALIAVAISIIIIEFFLGNYVSSHHILSFNIINNEVYQSDYTNYQKTFFCRYGRTASMQEVEGVFEK